jgi:competence protein ComEC
MITWLGASLAWLLGVALQFLSDGLTAGRPSLAVAWAAVGGGATCLMLAAWQSRGAPRAATVFALLGVFALGAGSTGLRTHLRLQEAWPAHLDRVDVRADIRIEGLPQWRSGRWRVDAEVLRWIEAGPPAEAHGGRALARLPGRLQLHVPDAPGGPVPRAGQVWRATLRLHAPDALANPGVSGGTLHLFARGVRAVGQVRPGWEQVAVADEGNWGGLQERVDRLRQLTRDRLMQRLGGSREAGILAGLSIGDQSAIDRDAWEVLRRTGTAHLVSISGAHVAMLGVLCAWAVRRSWSAVPGLIRLQAAPQVAAWVALLVSTGYAWLAGWGVPAQRTVWMMAVATLLMSLGRRWPWPMVWVWCAAVVSALDPWALWQPGFWLSFVAVGVLLAAGVRIPDAAPTEVARWGGVFGPLRAAAGELLRTQRLVAVALTPVALVCFQQVSVVGLGVNLLAVPVFTALLTPLALAGACWSPCWDLAAWVLRAVWWLLSQASQLSWAVLESPHLPLWVSCMGVLAAWGLALPVPWRWRALVAPFLLPFVLLPDSWHLQPRPPPGHFSVVVADVGQAGAVLVRTANRALLFDAGARQPDGSDAGQKVLLPLMRALGIRRLDHLMISHADIDHIGGAASVLSGVPVTELSASMAQADPFWQEARRLREGLLTGPCLAGRTWTWDGVRFDVLHPQEASPQRLSSDNARSCVLRVQAGQDGPSLLLTGDIEAAQEKELVERLGAEGLSSTVMLVPHHGSRTSSTEAFLEAVDPQQAVIQVGARNRHGHPAQAVLQRHAERGIDVVGTPGCGAFLWRSDEAGRPASHPTSGAGDLGGPRIGTCWRQVRRVHWETEAATDQPGD